MVCEMLDELYIRFDAVMELPEFQPCYKVETIGDAYMIVCGITEPCEDHAEMVLKVALELVKAAQLVHVNGNPLTIRVGASQRERKREQESRSACHAFTAAVNALLTKRALLPPHRRRSAALHPHFPFH